MKTAKYIVYLLVIVVISLEVLLRLLGMHTDYNQKYELLDCYGNFVEFNTKLGYYNKTVDTKCKIKNPEKENDFLYYEIKQMSDGSRYTGEACNKSYKKSIHFYGCSVTWGHGVSDSSTYPYQVQKLVGNEMCVKNFGVGSYSTLQSYLLFEQNLVKGDTPSIAVLNYGSFQDTRNTMSLDWRLAWYTMAHQAASDSMDIIFPEFKVPYARMEGDSLAIKYFSKSDMNISFIRKTSAIADNIYKIYERDKDDRIDHSRISLHIIEKMKKICEKEGIVFVLSGIYNSAETKEKIDYFQSNRTFAVDISVNHSDKNLNLTPYDAHLNGKGYYLFAEKLYVYLKNNSIIE